MRKRGMALVAAVVMLLTSGIFLPGQNKVYAEDQEEGHLILEKLEWQCTNPDKENLGDGDIITVTATVRNNRNENMTIDPTLCGITWKYPELEDSHWGVDGIGEKEIVEPGKTATVTFQVELTKFEIKGKHTLSGVRIFTSEGYGIGYQSASAEEGYLDGWVNSDKVASFRYDGNLDFTVTSSQGADHEPPEIYSMKALENPIEDSEEVTYQISLSDYGVAKPTEIWVVFQDIKNEENKQETGASLIDSGNTGVYTCTFSFDPMLTEGTYKIVEVSLYDEAANMIRYSIVDGELKDIFDKTLKVDDLVVAGSSGSGPDTDETVGDINGDGMINVLDLGQCMNHIVGKTELTGEKFQAADVNGDGTINILDLGKIMNYTVGKINKF